MAGIDDTIKKMGLDYLAMMIIHSPQPWVKVNQILFHISNTPLELVEYCQRNGIVVEVYSPIAYGEILEMETLHRCV